MFLPTQIGNSNKKNGFAMGQLSFRITDNNSPEGYCFGSILPAISILPSEFIRRIPLGYPISRKLNKMLQPSLLLGNCFMSGSYSKNVISIARSGSIQIKGGYSDAIYQTLKDLKRRISVVMGYYKTAMLPFSFQLAMPGEDIHYAGSLPMKASPQIYETLPNCEVSGLPGVYAVDGSALTSLPSKSHTLTIMANADRIAKHLVENL